MKRLQAGMTLLEVMIAMAVFALAGLAVMNSASEHLGSLSYLEQKSMAQWVASNRLAELKLERAWPGDEWRKGTTEMAATTWYWSYRGAATADPRFRAIELEVRDSEAGAPLALLTTYVARQAQQEATGP